MSPARPAMPRALPPLLLLAVVLAALAWFLRPRPLAPPPTRAPPSVHAFTHGAPPPLLPIRLATPEAPAFARERLLAADGSPAEDLAALTDLVTGYLHSGLGPARLPLGFNEDLIPALTDRAALGDAALPPDHPAIREGRLLDRWGTPWQVHPLASDHIQLRSAGPDRRLYTPDDLVTPPDTPSQE